MDPTVVFALEEDPEVRNVAWQAILLKDVKASLDTRAIDGALQSQ